MKEHRDYENRVPSTEAERQAVAAAKLAVIDAQRELFASFGIVRDDVESMEEFKECLRMMRALKKRAQDQELWGDLDFLHSIRSGSAKAWSRFALALITILAGAFAWGIVAVVRAWVATVVAKSPH